jgi:hypothetical protein
MMGADRRNMDSKPKPPAPREPGPSRPAAWSFHASALDRQSKQDRGVAPEKAAGTKRFSIILWDEPEQRRAKRRPDKD